MKKMSDALDTNVDGDVLKTQKKEKTKHQVQKYCKEEDKFSQGYAAGVR